MAKKNYDYKKKQANKSKRKTSKAGKKQDIRRIMKNKKPKRSLDIKRSSLKTNFKGIIKSFKNKITSLVNKYDRSNKLIKKLKENLKEKEKHIFSLDKSNTITNISQIYNPTKYSRSYTSKSIKLYNEYKDFIYKKYKSKNKKLNMKLSSKSRHIYDMKNVKDFLINTKNYTNSTFINRYNLLRRTLIKMDNGNNKLINDLKIIESKKGLRNENISDDEYSEFLIFLFKEKDINLILFHILSYIFGFNISEITNIKIKNFKDNFSNIKMKRNLGVVNRKIIEPFRQIFILYINKYSLGYTDYLIYPEIKNMKEISRVKYLEEKYKNFIIKIKSLSRFNFDLFIKDVHIEKTRKNISFKMNFIFKFVEKIIINKDYELTDLLNKFSSENCLNNENCRFICDNEMDDNRFCSFCKNDSFEEDRTILSKNNCLFEESLNEKFNSGKNNIFNAYNDEKLIFNKPSIFDY